MELYLVRHAKAVPAQEGDTFPDAERPLTPDGEGQAQQLAQTLQRRGVRLETIVTSPFLRARQTAEILQRDWPEPKPEIVVADELTPETKPRKLMRFLRELRREHVALVGHEPTLGKWTAWLIGSKKADIAYAKAGVAHVYWESELPRKGTGTLLWLVTPSWFGEPPLA